MTTQNGFDGKKLVVKGHFTCGGAPTGSTSLCLVRHPTPSGGQPDKMMRKKAIIILGTARFVTAEYEWIIMMRPDGTLIFLEKTIRKRIALRLKSRDTF